MALGRERLFISLILGCVSYPALAQGNLNNAESSLILDKGELIEPPWWLSTHRSISLKVDQWSQGLDSFLSGDEEGAPDDSYVQIRSGSTVRQFGGSSGFFDFRTRLKLPNTKDRLRLVIDSDGERLTSDNLTGERGQQNSVKDSVSKSTVSAALRYIEDSWGADFDVGILVGFPLDPFTRVRFTQGHEGQSYSWWQREEAFLYYSKGAGAHYTIGVARRASDSVSYGADFSSSWLKQEDMLYARENIFIHHRLSDTSHLTYQLSYLQQGQSSFKANSYLYFVQYDRTLYKNWLIGQIKPQMTYEAENDYRANASLTLSLEILFGRAYL